MSRNIKPWLSISGIILLILIAIAYLLGYMLKLPFPLLPKYDYEVTSTQLDLMNSWNNVSIYEMKQKPETVEEIIEVEPTIDTSENEFYSMFNELDRASMETYIQSNPDCISNGYGKLFIDKADKDNTATGIKTANGDDVLVVDVHNNLLIVGINLNGYKGKLAILKDKSQVGLSASKDMKYWEQIESHAKNEQAILAINANGFNYNSVGDYYTLYGLAIRNGEAIRKAYDQQQVVGFTQDGELQVGSNADVSNLYNASEFMPILIKNGDVVLEDKSDTRMARTAIGQGIDGTTYMLVVEGGESTSNKGVTLTELTEVFKKYSAVNAANLSGGNRSIMYWNGKVINNTFGYPEEGLRLPTAFVIKSSNGSRIGTDSNRPNTSGNEYENVNPPSASEIIDGNAPEDEKDISILK